MPIFRLTKDLVFPPVHLAEDGLLAIGGDLSRERLLLAYANGIFPWYSEGEPILWWSPDPRMILIPSEMHVSRSLRKTLRKKPFRLSLDTAFEQVITACAQTPRAHEDGTWITPEMIAAYMDLHQTGFAHSIEVWQEERLVGGVYGVALGGCFFGESMFSHVTNASKVALATFCCCCPALGIALIDCQVENPHLISLGAKEVPRDYFFKLLAPCFKAPSQLHVCHDLDALQHGGEKQTL